VGERSWNTVAAAKVAPLLAVEASAGVSLVMIGRHALAAFDDLAEDLLEADANSSFRVLEIALATLFWSSSSAEVSPSPSIPLKEQWGSILKLQTTSISQSVTLATKCNFGNRKAVNCVA
jgi:hypothetical protein